MIRPSLFFAKQKFFRLKTSAHNYAFDSLKKMVLFHAMNRSEMWGLEQRGIAIIAAPKQFGFSLECQR
jgi:hypothetical protein